MCGGVCCCFIFCLLFYAELCKVVLITIITISIKLYYCNISL